MARFDRLTVLNAMVGTGLVPVFYNRDVEVAKKIVAACAEEGTKVVEFTNRGDRAWNVFTQLIEWAEVAYPQVVTLVGTDVGRLLVAGSISFNEMEAFMEGRRRLGADGI